MAYHQMGKPNEASAAPNDAARAEDGWIQKLYGGGVNLWVHHKGAAAAWAVAPSEWLEFQVLSREARRQSNDTPPQVDPRWLVVRARTFASLGRLGEAVGEYKTALSLIRADAQLRMELHRVLAYTALGRADYVNAAAEFAEASRLAPNDALLSMYQAQAHLDGGNLDAYRGVCGEMLRRFAQTNDPWAASRVVHVCANRADSLSDMTKLLPLAEVAAGAYLGAIRLKGVASVRAGRYAEAIQCFEESKLLHAPHPLDMCFEGIAYFHLGELEQSRRCVRQARDWMDQANREPLPPTDWATPAWWNLPWHERTDAQRLLAEAESLVNAR